MDNKQIANEIWNQMKAMDSNLCMCMGVQSLTIIENGLQFKVNGLSFKGIVQIVLSPKDLYNVSFIKMTRKQNEKAKASGLKMFDSIPEVVKKVEDVYFDELMPLLEDVVENRKVS